VIPKGDTMSETRQNNNGKKTETVLKIEIDPTGILKSIADSLSALTEQKFVSAEEHLSRVRDLIESNNKLVNEVRVERHKNNALIAEMRDLRRLMYRATGETT
jgi:hypothetical protein